MTSAACSSAPQVAKFGPTSVQQSQMPSIPATPKRAGEPKMAMVGPSVKAGATSATNPSMMQNTMASITASDLKPVPM